MYLRASSAIACPAAVPGTLGAGDETDAGAPAALRACANAAEVLAVAAVDKDGLAPAAVLPVFSCASVAWIRLIVPVVSSILIR
jgi:hypothetical protein